MKFQFRVYGVKQINAALTRIGKGIQNFIPAWTEISDDFFDVAEVKLFASKGHGKWEALSEKYAAWKEKNYPGRPLLVLSGRLKTSLTSGNSSTINEKSPLVLKMGTRAMVGKYNLGRVHFEGRKDGTMPARRPIDLTPSDASRWMKIIQVYVANLIKGLT